MRFLSLAVTSAAFALAACGGGDKAATDTTGAAAPAMAAPAAAPAATGAPMPITGQTVEVKMVGDEKGYRYEPAEITVKAGDGIKFVMVSGGPHNVSFDPATVPAAAKAQLKANMPEQMDDMVGKLLTAPNEEYIISFAGVAPGTYDFFCTPHLAFNMKGKVTVQ